MNIEQIKNIISNSSDDIELDVLLSLDHLLNNHRSVFLDQKIYDLGAEQYDLLKKYILKSVDVSECGEGKLKNFFCIPITIGASQCPEFTPIVNNIDPSLLKSILCKSSIFTDDVIISSVILPKRTIFGGNIFNIFDTTRDAVGVNLETYIDNDILLKESDGQYVFYVIGYEYDSLSAIEQSEWEKATYFLSSRLTKCCGVDVKIHKPLSVSKEYSYSFFRDLNCRFKANIEKELICSIDSVTLYIQNDFRDSVIVFNNGECCVATVELGKVHDSCLTLAKKHLSDFASENGIRKHEIKVVNGSFDCQKTFLESKAPFLKLIK